MIRRVRLGDLLVVVVAADRVAGLAQLADELHQLRAVLAGDLLAPDRELVRLEEVRPAADKLLVGSEVDVDRGRAALADLSPRERDRRADVRLVRRLVLREPDVAMDPHHLRLAELDRLVGRRDPRADLGEELLHRRDPLGLVARLVLEEPVTVHFDGELVKERRRRLREAGECHVRNTGGVTTTRT